MSISSDLIDKRIRVCLTVAAVFFTLAMISGGIVYVRDGRLNARRAKSLESLLTMIDTANERVPDEYIRNLLRETAEDPSPKAIEELFESVSERMSTPGDTHHAYAWVICYRILSHRWLDREHWGTKNEEADLVDWLAVNAADESLPIFNDPTVRQSMIVVYRERGLPIKTAFIRSERDAILALATPAHGYDDLSTSFVGVEGVDWIPQSESGG